MYILLNIDHNVVNMKAIIIVVCQNLQLLFLYWDPGKPHTVVLYRKCCIYVHFTQSNQQKYTDEGFKYGDNKGYFIIL